LTQPSGEVSASLGDLRITRQIRKASRRINPQDEPDLSQGVHGELLEEFGDKYREILGSPCDSYFASTHEYKVLDWCVDRVRKRLVRVKRPQSLDQLKEQGNYVPVDPRSCKAASSGRMTTLLALQRDRLTVEERRMLELLLAEVPLIEIMHELGMGRTNFFTFKRKVFEEIAHVLLRDD